MYWSITFEDLCLAGISERVGSLLDPAYCSWPFLLGLGLTYGRHMAHLNLSMRTGIPKWLRPDRRQTLMREGIYRVVRHPVYLTAAVAGISLALVINYLGVYILFVSALPVLYLITILEERELVARFGEEYGQYQREVPQLIPRWETIRRGLRP